MDDDDGILINFFDLIDQSDHPAVEVFNLLDVSQPVVFLIDR